MYRLRKKKVENMPSETEKATALPAEKAGILKNDSGIIGCGERASQTSRPTIRAAMIWKPNEAAHLGSRKPVFPAGEGVLV